MRGKVRDKGRLEHILDAIDNIFEFTKNITFEEFIANKMLKFAVIKNIEIIGEASYMLTKEFREKHTHVEWDIIIKMRHVLVHGYYQIEDRFTWFVIENDLYSLKEKIKTIYEQEYINEAVKKYGDDGESSRRYFCFIKAILFQWQPINNQTRIANPCEQSERGFFLPIHRNQKLIIRDGILHS